MLTMDQIHLIRELFFRQGKNISEIANTLGVDWRTARKYVDKEDFNEPVLVAKNNKPKFSKLDPFKPLIDEWLESDCKCKRYYITFLFLYNLIQLFRLYSVRYKT